MSDIVVETDLLLIKIIRIEKQSIHTERVKTKRIFIPPQHEHKNTLTADSLSAKQICTCATNGLASVFKFLNMVVYMVLKKSAKNVIERVMKSK